MSAQPNHNQINANMKTRLTTLGRASACVIGLALSLTTSLFGQSVATVISSNLFEPNSITTDPNNIAYLTDGANNRVMKYNASSGSFGLLAGNIGAAGTNNGAGISARFRAPAGIVYARGGLVVADSGNHMLRFVSLAGVVSNLSGAYSTYGDMVDGPAASAQFSYPLGLAADAAGNIFIADSGNDAIRLLDTNNVVSTYATGFYQPAAVAVGDNGDLWVADTRNDVIVRIDSNKVPTVISGSAGISGSQDGTFAIDGRLNLPSGLLWVSSATGLLISDTGNNTIRRLYFNNQVNDWTLETAAGQAGVAGRVDGAPLASTFNAPIGVWYDVLDSGFFVIDRAGNDIRRLQTSVPQAPVADPIVGFVTFEFDPEKGQYVSVFTQSPQAVFNNPVVIAIKAEVGTQTYITYGDTPPNSFEDSIPSPNAQTGTSPTIYRGNGLSADQSAPSIVPLGPDFTIKSIGMATGRRPSNVTTNRYQFQVANPSFSGDNAAAFSFQDITTNASLWFTLDGSDPTNTPSGSNIGPVVSGQKISINITSNTTVKVRGFLDKFLPSQIVTKIFAVTNFNANKITFGFDAGEASSDFVAAAGQKFFAPVTLTLLPGQTIYSMQFNVTVTNVPGSPAVQPNGFGFESMLLTPLIGEKPPIYQVIPPSMFNGDTNAPGMQSLLITNTSENLLGVGWFERLGKTNLYDTHNQDLISYSMVHNTLFSSSKGKVLVGSYSFQVPQTALPGQGYQIQLGRPSGTEDGISAPAFILSPTNGSLGAGTINGTKIVTVGSRPYLVGDCVPFRWINAGDFGDTNLVNADISDLFQAVAYRINRPPDGSDFFDCMDSSDGSGSLDGNDTQINNIQFGDKVLGIDDIYVTLRRSLDPSLTWYTRYWSNGVRNVAVVPNVVTGAAAPAAQNPIAPRTATGPRFVHAQPDDVQVVPGSTIQIPIRASIVGNLPIRVMALNLDVMPLDGSPAITTQVSFAPAAGLGAATLTSSQGSGNAAGAWLNSTTAGVSGTNILGMLTVTLPTNATATSAWVVRFSHLTCSPNGVGLFPLTTQDGLITVGNRSTSSWGDGIPDSWRLRWFGSVSNLLSAANLDPDGDGHSNYAEFVAGTNPLDGVSHLNVNCSSGAPRTALTWPSIFGKQYSVECSSTLFGGSWSVIGTNLSGTGQAMQFADPNAANGLRFYRVKVQ
jgi:hypothetical protein